MISTVKIDTEVNMYCKLVARFSYKIGLNNFKAKFYNLNQLNNYIGRHKYKGIYIITVPLDMPDAFIVERALLLHEIETWEYLVECGLKPPPRVLFWATKNGHLDIVRWLMSRHGHCIVVERGYYMKVVNFPTDRNIALKLAVEKGHLKVAKYLIECGAVATEYILQGICKRGDVELFKCIQNVKPQEALLECGRHGNLELVKYLHTTCTFTLDTYCSLLERAIIYGHVDMVKYLEENNIINCEKFARLCKDIFGYPELRARFLLFNTCMNGHLEMIKYLFTQDLVKFFPTVPIEGLVNGVVKSRRLDIFTFLMNFHNNRIKLKTEPNVISVLDEIVYLNIQMRIWCIYSLERKHKVLVDLNLIPQILAYHPLYLKQLNMSFASSSTRDDGLSVGQLLVAQLFSDVATERLRIDFERSRRASKRK